MKAIKIRYFLFMIGLAFCLTGCKPSVNYDEIGQTLLGDLPDLIFANEFQYDFPEEYQGHKITWEFAKSDYIDESGKFIEPPFHDATLKLSVFVDGEKAGTKNITLSRNLTNYFSEIEKYVKSFIKDRARGDVRLMTTYYDIEGIEIGYTSSKPEIVDNTGKYYNHEYDEEIIFDVSVSFRGKTHEFQVKHISVGIPDMEKVVKIDEWLQEELANMTFVDGMELPQTHPLYGGRIRWIAEDPFVVLNNKDFFLPMDEGTYMLMAEINYPGAFEYFRYFVDLQATEIKDPLERAKCFIEVATPKEIEEFIVLYNGEGANITRNIIGDDVNWQVHGGTKPEVPQNVLDSRMYEGYTMPNEDNVLWIVVHETGMKLTGLFAEAFDKVQWDRATGDTEPDSVSWHYTVDDHQIIQNYEDDIACWHAGDGSAIGGGNKNGIGIEMCINPDGKYDASFRNDARLVASLLIRHNLNMANVKRHRDFMSKDCPETMIKERRWFEFLDLVAKEYISQTLLSQFEITYEINSEALATWPIAGVYQKVDGFTEDITVIAKIASEELSLAIKLN
ncbi:MAG: N-acetylmuramoyl-L-alanine amidase [Bacilli bacterium]|jgi:hypothetical protein|nr:N-acetylmuramoyl-L-alanine amidase [Bacilli bacterium]